MTACTLICAAVALAQPPADPTPDPPSGRVIVLPGVENISLYLFNFVGRMGQRYPHLEATIRTWGPPIVTFYNLQAYERNLRTAAAMADEIAEYRRAHPHDTIDIVGFSGGGGIAVLVVAALPADITINRLILVAPAISYDYPLESEILPHVSDVVVNYASTRDLVIGWGTRQFGTIDRKYVRSAGYDGFNITHPKLIQVHWTPDMIATGHFGLHFCIILDAWQDKYVLPTLDRARDVREVLRARCPPAAPERERRAPK